MSKKMTYDEWTEQALSDGWRPPLHGKVTKEQVSDYIGEEAFLIPDYGKKYWITKSGRVVSAAFGRLKELKIQTGSNIIYPFLSLSNGENMYLHRVMGEMFIPNKNAYPVVNHINGNKDDYSLDNLEWCTHRGNVAHAFKYGLRHPVKGSKHKNSRLKEKDVVEIRTQLSLGYRVAELSQQYGVAHSQISAIKNGKAWVHVKAV